MGKDQDLSLSNLQQSQVSQTVEGSSSQKAESTRISMSSVPRIYRPEDTEGWKKVFRDEE